MVLKSKRILVGISGGIAAYKSAELVRRLKEQGAEVRVVLTQNGSQFITPLTLQALSGNPVAHDLFDLEAEAAMGHIELARWADAIVVAPATANFLARLAQGLADDLLTTLCLVTHSPILVAPSMNQGMWLNAFTQTNLAKLREADITILGPDAGSQACGEVGMGRLLEPEAIVLALKHFFGRSELLAQQNILITAGPTQEAIDPVRFIANHSSGKMGYALAKAAVASGAKVTLISGPVQLTKPRGLDFISVVSAEEMYQAVLEKIKGCDIFFSVAAVCDYQVKTPALQKIKKVADELTLTLTRTPDIVAAVSQLPHKPFVVGFAAETENVIEYAKRKYQQKNMDMIIANRVGKNLGMNTDDNAVTIISDQEQVDLPLMPKSQLAQELIAIIAKKRGHHD